MLVDSHRSPFASEDLGGEGEDENKGIRPSTRSGEPGSYRAARCRVTQRSSQSARKSCSPRRRRQRPSSRECDRYRLRPPNIRVVHEHLLGYARRQHSKPPHTMGTPCFEEIAQPQYGIVSKSLSPITGHAANSRNDSRPSSSVFGFFLFSSTTLCAFGSAPFSPGSVTHT